MSTDKEQIEEIQKFWVWFTANNSQFLHLEDDNRDEKLDLILDYIRPVADGLAVELSNEFNGIRDLVISPDGDENNFSIVKKIIAEAPSIKGWTFTAFRQKVSGDFTLKYNNISFQPLKMYFYPKNIDDDQLDIAVYINDIKNAEKKDVDYYGLITMDNVLREYDSVKKVRYYSFHELRDVKDKHRLMPLAELSEYINEVRKRN